MMNAIRRILFPVLAAGLFFLYAGCERHSYDETSKLQHHGDHAEGGGHGAGGASGDGHEEQGKGRKAPGKKGERGEAAHGAEKKAEGGRKVF